MQVKQLGVANSSSLDRLWEEFMDFTPLMVISWIFYTRENEVPYTCVDNFFKQRLRKREGRAQLILIL